MLGDGQLGEGEEELLLPTGEGGELGGVRFEWREVLHGYGG